MTVPGSGAFPARAKVNLFLHVGDTRDDGFHPLQSLAVFTDLGDALTAQAGQGLCLSIEGPFAAGLQAEGDNVLYKGACSLWNIEKITFKE